MTPAGGAADAQHSVSIGRADVVVRTRAREVIDDWRSSKTEPIQQLSRLIAQTSQEYADRFLMELIQNGYDAHDPESADGRIAVTLDETDGDYGSIAVANTGHPFVDHNFKALASLGLSDKGAGEGIGNKGLGFKSVLQICDWPEVFSQEPSRLGQDSFSGYCFGFADDNDLASLTLDAAEYERALTEVSRYLLPVPLPPEAQDAAVRAFAAAGYSTVVRLRFKSDANREVATARMHELTDPDVPVLLFLDRLVEISLVWRTSSGESAETLTRRGGPRSPLHGAPGVAASPVDLGDLGQYVLLTHTVDRDGITQALTSSIEAGHVDERWASWQGDTTVAVALRTDSDLECGRLFTFLPMGEQSPAPFPAHVHAPFFVRLARTELHLDVEYNRRLLQAIAELCAVAAQAFASTATISDARMAIDLICWNSQVVELTEAFVRRGGQIEREALIAVLPRPSRSRASLGEVRVWTCEGAAVLTDGWLAEHLDLPIVDLELGANRIERLQATASLIVDDDLLATYEELAEWSAERAHRLQREPWDAERWMAFYDDLAVIFSDAPEALYDRKIIIDDNRRLRSAGQHVEGGPTVFFYPVRNVQGEEDIESALDIDLPHGLRRRLTFTNRELEWYQDRQATAARVFFASLIRRYNTAEVLTEIGALLKRKPSESAFADALRFVFRLHNKVGESGLSLDSLNLRVPTRSGWIGASDARFSAKWATPAAASLRSLISEAGAMSGELAALEDRIILDPDEWPGPPIDRDAWVSFLSRIGVRDGLWPEFRGRRVVRRSGRNYLPVVIAAELELSEEGAEAFNSLVPDQAGFPNYPETDYENQSPFWRFPAQDDVTSFPDTSRRRHAELVLRALCATGSDFAYAPVRRKNYPGDPVSMWPTPLGAFLACAAWIPVSRRGAEEFVPLHCAWHFDDRGSAPSWAPTVPADLARLIDGGAQEALYDTGLSSWIDPANAPKLLATLTDLIEGGEVAPTPERLFVRTCEDAWQKIVREPVAGFEVWVPDDAVVRVGDRVRVVDLRNADAPVYIDDGSDPGLMRALRGAGTPVLCARTQDAQLLATRLRMADCEVRVLSEVDVVPLVDDRPFVRDPSAPLLVSMVGGWVPLLMKGALEFHSGPFRRLQPEDLRAAISAVMRLRVQTAASISLTVDGRPIQTPAGGNDAMLVADDEHPTVVIVDTIQGRWSIAETITKSLADLVENAELKDVLFSAVVRLRRLTEGSGDEEPTRSQIAACLNIDESDLNAAADLVRLSIMELATRLTIVLAARNGPGAAAEFFAAARVLEDESELSAVLQRYAADADVLLSHARELANAHDLRRALDLPFSAFDVALVAYGLPTIQNPEAQRDHFSHYLNQKRMTIVDQLRAHFLSRFQRCESLVDYVALRDLPALEPDPDWVPVCELPVPAMMDARIEEWLKSHDVTLNAEFALSPLDEIRAENTMRLRQVLARARELVQAWCMRERAAPNSAWSQSTDLQAIVDWVSDQGLLDFELVDPDRMLAELLAGGFWPSAMPRSVDLDALGLTEEDLTRAQNEEARAQAELRYERVSVQVGGSRFGCEPEDLTRLRDLLIFESGPALATRVIQTSLADALPPPDRTKKRRGTRAVGRRQGLSDEQATIVGFAGEVLALEWLKLEQPDDQVFWASGYRDLVLGGTEGQDNLGYDICVIGETNSKYFEVKASKGDDLSFDLTPGEVEFARSRARKADYTILYVRHALAPTQFSILPLPNPFSKRGRDCYRTSGGLHLEFWLDG